MICMSTIDFSNLNLSFHLGKQLGFNIWQNKIVSCQTVNGDDIPEACQGQSYHGEVNVNDRFCFISIPILNGSAINHPVYVATFWACTCTQFMQIVKINHST